MRLATRRSWNIRAALTSAVIRPPHTAASRIATPNGRLQCQLRKVNGVAAVFWAMKISNTIRIRNPEMSEDHSAAARVNFTSWACSPGELPVSGSATTGGVGSPGGEFGSLLIGSSWSLPGRKETTNPATGK